MWLYINRGLGQGGLAFRFLSRREVTIITLHQGAVAPTPGVE